MKRTRSSHSKGGARAKRSASKKQTLKEQQKPDVGPTANGEIPNGADEERPVSPDPNCSICLCKMDDKSFTHSCFHMFCFTCLLEWSKVKAVCPLCKQPFNSIIHNIRSESDYDVYDLKDNVVDATAVVTASDTDDGVPPDLAMFGNDRLSLYPWDNLIGGFEFLPQFLHSAQWLPLSFFSGSNIRRRVYQSRRRTQEIPLPEATVHRDVSPEYFAGNASGDHIRRIRVWLDGELAIIFPANNERQQYVRELIVHLLGRFHILSQEFSQHLHQLLGDRTHLFVNELYNFACSPSVAEADRLTFRDDSMIPPEDEIITLDRDDSDVEIISPPVNNNTGFGGSRVRGSFSQNASDCLVLLSPSDRENTERCRNEGDVTAGGMRSGSPVAGPSGLPAARPDNGASSGSSAGNHEPRVHELSDSDSSSTSVYDNEIMVVGFDKPWRARTPISLSSNDSDIEVDDDTITNPTNSRKTSPSSEQLLELDSCHSSDSCSSVDMAGCMKHDDDCSSDSWSEHDAIPLPRTHGVKKLRFFHGAHDSVFQIRLRTQGRRIDHGLDVGDSCHRFSIDFTNDQSVAETSRNICHTNFYNTCGNEHCKNRQLVHVNRFQNSTDEERCPHSRDRPVLEELKSLKKPSKKRCHEECGDSGVVVNVEQRRSAETRYKKHCSGHKKSSFRMEKSLNNESGASNDTCSTTNRLADSVVKLASETAMSAGLNLVCGGRNSSQSVERSLEARESSLKDSGSNESRLAEEDRVEMSSESRLTDTLVCCDPVPTVDSGRRSFTTSPKRGSPTEPARDVSTSSDEILVPKSLASPRICDLDFSPSAEVDPIDIDSDDSIEWLEVERPEPVVADRRRRHISICSGDLSVTHPSTTLEVLQLSDDEEGIEKTVPGSALSGVPSSSSSHSPSEGSSDNSMNCAESHSDAELEKSLCSYSTGIEEEVDSEDCPQTSSSGPVSSRKQMRENDENVYDGGRESSMEQACRDREGCSIKLMCGKGEDSSDERISDGGEDVGSKDVCESREDITNQICDISEDIGTKKICKNGEDSNPLQICDGRSDITNQICDASEDHSTKNIFESREGSSAQQVCDSREEITNQICDASEDTSTKIFESREGSSAQQVCDSREDITNEICDASEDGNIKKICESREDSSTLQICDSREDSTTKEICDASEGSSIREISDNREEFSCELTCGQNDFVGESKIVDADRIDNPSPAKNIIPENHFNSEASHTFAILNDDLSQPPIEYPVSRDTSCMGVLMIPDSESAQSDVDPGASVVGEETRHSSDVTPSIFSSPSSESVLDENNC